MMCIYCGSDQTAVFNTRETEYGRWRRRHCLSCDKRFTTIEVPKSDDTMYVVRCKDCKYWDDKHSCCTNSDGLFATGRRARENYCSYGEKAEE
jgi:transcriptional regulator NrdR family protein